VMVFAVLMRCRKASTDDGKARTSAIKRMLGWVEGVGG